MQDGRLYACIRSSPALHGRSERLYTSKEAAAAAVSTSGASELWTHRTRGSKEAAAAAVST